MSIQFRVYANDGAGGPVDLSSPVLTTASASADMPALAPGSDVTYLVRAYDTGSGLEDQHSDRRVRVVVGPDGLDATGLPAAPVGLTAVATAGGGARVSWRYPPGSGPAPAGFLAAGGSTSASVPYDPADRGRAYRADVAGLADGVPAVVTVAAYNAAGAGPAASCTVVGNAAGPASVGAVAASVVP